MDSFIVIRNGYPNVVTANDSFKANYEQTRRSHEKDAFGPRLRGGPRYDNSSICQFSCSVWPIVKIFTEDLGSYLVETF